MRSLAQERLGFGGEEVVEPVPLDQVELPASARLAAAVACRDLRGRPACSRLARDGQGVPRHRARLPWRVRERPRRRRPAANGGRGRGRPRLVLRRGLRRDPLRRRHQRLRRSGAAPARRVSGRRHDRPGGARPGARGRRGLPLGAIQAGAPGPGPRGPAPRARADDALLSAVVRVLDPRRVGRDARRRPLRDEADPRRRHGRVGSRDHARGRVAEPPPARLGRGPEPRPHDDRVRGNPRA